MRLTNVLAVVGGLSLGAAILFPVFAQAKMCSKCLSSLSNVKQLGLAELVYAGDNGERFTSRDLWMDAMDPYIKNPSIFHRPGLPKGAWGYAFNGSLDRAKSPQNPDRVPLIYESVNPAKNASDLVTSLPSPGLHNGRDDIVYADGHVKAIRVGTGQ